jgi:hypothetical protein
MDVSLKYSTRFALSWLLLVSPLKMIYLSLRSNWPFIFSQASGRLSCSLQVSFTAYKKIDNSLRVIIYRYSCSI